MTNNYFFIGLFNLKNPLLLFLFWLPLFSSKAHSGQANQINLRLPTPPPPTTSYYSITGGALTSTIWSLTSHSSASCSCTPDATCDFDVPANTTIYIAHAVTTACNITIGSNATIVIENGGSLTVTGNASISGTGFFQVDAGGSAVVTGNFTVSGTGDATINGTLTVGGNVTLTSGAGSNICGGGTISVVGTVTGSTDPCFTGVLPIELLDFNAVLNGDKVDLTWKTASETNNDYFTIERSKDSELWAAVAIVDGAGTSSEIISYQDFDMHPIAGTSYYRLKQTDYDGLYSYSQIAVVHNNNANGMDVSAFPNPNDGNSFNLEFTGFSDEEVLLVIRDIQGKEYYSKMYLVTDHNSIIAISLESKLAAGMYLIIASSDDALVTKKITVR